MVESSSIVAIGGGTIVVTEGASVYVHQRGREIARFQTRDAVSWISVSPDGKTILLHSTFDRRIDRWDANNGLSTFATASSQRDLAGVGFLAVDGDLLTLHAQNGLLRAVDLGGGTRFTANIAAPHWFLPRTFVDLPGGRIALIGAFFADSSSSIVTLARSALAEGGDAIQTAINDALPISDRAACIAVGPCESGAAAVLRDPGEDEVLGDDDDLDDYPDIWGFKGVYVRSLSTGELLEKHVYAGTAGSGVPLLAGNDWIAIEVKGGVDIIARATSRVFHYRATCAVDIYRHEIATLSRSGIEVRPIDELWEQMVSSYDNNEH